MTGTRAERAGLQNTARPQLGGFPPLASRNDDQTPNPALGQRFSTGNAWQASSGIWGNSIGGGYAARDARARDLDNLREQPSGSGALTASSEAEPWSTRNGPWSQVDTTSPTLSTAQSGANSPIRHRGSIQSTRGELLGELPNTSPYFTSRHLGQASGGTVAVRADNLTIPGMRLDRSQFPAHLSIGNRDSSIASTRNSDLGIPASNIFQQSSFSLNHTPRNSISHHQSFSGRAPSFSHVAPSTMEVAAAPQQRDAEITAELARFSFGGKGEHNSYGRHQTGDPAFSSPGNRHAQPRFKLNAQSPMFHGQPGSRSMPFGPDAMADASATGRFPAPSGHLSGRNSVSPAGSERRGLGSPNYYGNTMDAELRQDFAGGQVPSAAYIERRLQQYQNQQTAPFPPPQLLYTGAYPAQSYDLNGNNFRLAQAALPYPYQLPVTGTFNPLQMAPRGPRDDVGHGVRSPLLEEFRANAKSNRRYDLKDIYGHIVEFSGDTHGSRFIQQKLETANSDEKEQVFREIQPNALQLMTDVFGNYVIQKLFEHGSQVQKRVLAETMRNHVHDLSLQMYGCRVVQKALEHVLADQQAELVRELQTDILKCVKDQHGNHVVQKAIERVPAEHTQFIVDAFKGQVHSLATHPYGCRVVQRMLEYCPESEQTAILQELHQCAAMLITDQYGNYVTQHIIAQGKPEHRAAIIKIVTAQLLTLSKHKFASNVVEKSIQFGTDEQRKDIVGQLTATQSDGTSPLQLLMKDQYGNYVIQKLLGQLKGAEREQFVEAIKPQLAQFTKYNYGKQIAAIEKLIFNGAPPNYGSATAACTTTMPLEINPRSEAPTPSLTMEQNSPQSCSPPSTNVSIDGHHGETTTGKVMPEVLIEGAESGTV